MLREKRRKKKKAAHKHSRLKITKNFKQGLIDSFIIIVVEANKNENAHAKDKKKKGFKKIYMNESVHARLHKFSSSRRSRYENMFCLS
jgi:hypothetical protein